MSTKISMMAQLKKGVSLLKEMRGILNAKSLLRNKALRRKQPITGISSTYYAYNADRDLVVKLKNSLTIPKFEIAYCLEADTIEKLLSTTLKSARCFLKQENEIYRMISKYSGDRPILIINTDLTLLPCNFEDNYGFFVFENLSVIKLQK